MEQDVDDILLISLARWDAPYSSTAWSLAKELAKHHRVFMIDNPFTWKDYFTKGKEAQLQNRKQALLRRKNIFSRPIGTPEKLTIVTPRLMLPVNWLSEGNIYDSVHRINQNWYNQALLQIHKKYGVERFGLLNVFNPFYGRIWPQDFQPDWQVYYTVDNISQSAYISKHGPRLETQMLQQADLVLATAMELQRKSQAQTEVPVHYLPNGADISLFQQATRNSLDRPLELKGETRKILLYIGAIGLRIDYELLEKVARHHSDKLLVLIGPQGGGYAGQELEKLPNVMLTGSKAIQELPAWLQHADCTLIPFLVNELTRSIYPLKINEYLAAGKAVVSTRFSPDLEGFESHIALADTHEAFVQAIEQSILTNTVEKISKRSAFSTQNSWTARANQLLLWIEELKLRKGI